jgi:hypothetical protein
MKNLSLANRWGIIMVLISIFGYGLSILSIKFFGQYSAIAGFISMPFAIFSFLIILFIGLDLASLHPILDNILVKEHDILPLITTTGFILHIIIYIGTYFLLGKILGKIIEQRKQIGRLFSKVFKPKTANNENFMELKQSHNKAAIIGFVFSLISIVYYLVGILGLIFGILALIQIRKTQEKGKILAIIAIIIGLIQGLYFGIIIDFI